MVHIPRMNSLNLGQTLGAASQIQGQRNRNALSQLALDQQHTAEKNRKKVQAARKMTDNAGNAIRQLREQGDFEAADKLLDFQRKQFKSTIDIVNGTGAWVRNQETYDLLRSNLVQQGIVEPDEMPVEYSKSFFTKQAKELKRKLSTLEQTVGVRNGVRQQRQLTQDEYGNVLAASPTYENSHDISSKRQLANQDRDYRLRASRENRLAKKDAGGGGLKASETNAIRSQIAAAFNSVFDVETGRINFRDDGQRRKAQQAQDIAEQLLERGEMQSGGRAAVEALRRVGVPIPRPSNSFVDPNNPGGFR